MPSPPTDLSETRLSNGPYRDQTDTHAPRNFADYRTTALRHPQQPLILLPQRITEITGPVLGEGHVTPSDADLTSARGGEASGQRIIVRGRVLDSDGRAVPNTLVEIWQANAAGRYRHTQDNWPAPLDPHFDGAGRVMTDATGEYHFTTVRPGAYPWGNHHNAWRPAHIHFSLLGRAFTQRLVTQMYFPDDPMFFQDPIYNAAPEDARARMTSIFDYEATQENWALGYRFDIVLRGRNATPFEGAEHDD
ncbi:protocatechuate 3,4-dioxygenase subunit beta [Rhodococcus ruber]|uniref:Protocatechuate 3,4-dioxygenase subunit beta n=1 Tax=Rhodococcus ruber TaxID=1830 RepID=A0ABT4MEQ3_9NOCA|nr:protocatechuate 3,4-dioxygenase subunit beta [Rhodococcus ruber]MCZ4519441.1 protocatechuate 3,4-dioxygenase subunit beta [Rhodococcus ruber]